MDSRQSLAATHSGRQCPMKTPFQIAADNFHAHLDVCPQCEQHPFDLCPIGHKLLMTVGTAEDQRVIYSKVEEPNQ